MEQRTPRVMMHPAGSDPRSERVIHVSVFGRVQGVGFRESMVEAANRLHVEGWVRNRRAGHVEAVVRGPSQACEALVQWARRGPATADVERVDVRVATDLEGAGLGPGFRRAPSL